MGKNGAFTSIKAMKPICARNYCILYHHALAKQKKQASAKNVLEAVKINFIKFQLLVYTSF